MYLQIFEINEFSSDFNEITEIDGFLSDFKISDRILGSVGPLAYLHIPYCPFTGCAKQLTLIRVD